MDTHDQLRRLRDKVRELELQNEQLRSRQLTRNGFEIKENLLSSLNDLSSYRNRVDQSTLCTEDDLLTPEQLRNEDFRDDGTWLYTSKTPANNPPQNLLSWLHHDKNYNDYEIQRIRKVLLNKIEEVEQGARRNSIDTRTFTRPKKRVSRPTLGMMSENPIFENSHHLFETPWKKFIAKDIHDNLDDIALKFEDSLPSFSSLSWSSTSKQCDRKDLNSTFVTAGNDDRFKINSPLLNSTFVKEGENSDPRSSDSDLSNSSRKGSNSNLNATFTVDSTLTPHKISRSRNLQADLNCTFSVSDVNRSGRALVFDGGADDDQLSSASDSSFSSTTRLMNVGDVQTIARLQEESLKQITSTPMRNSNMKDSPLLREEEHLSPINQMVQGGSQGYLSDHSDHSSGRARSSRSSVRSTPSGSPYGSNNALASDMSYVVPARKQEAKSPLKQQVRKPETGSRSVGVGRARPASGLRPPTVRPASTMTRPPAAVGSGIPRPASRIPAPRVRAPLTLQKMPIPKVPSESSKDDWLDGCF